MPASQTRIPRTSKVALKCAAMGCLLPAWTSPALAGEASAGGTAGAGFAASVAGARSSASKNWLPESNPVETDHSGRCQVCGTKDNSVKHGKLASARNQIQCRVAAAARRQQRHKPPATASTTRLLIHASKNSAVNAASCRHLPISSINAFVSASLLSGLIDHLLQCSQLRIRQPGIGRFQQGRHGLGDRALKECGNDPPQRGTPRGLAPGAR